MSAVTAADRATAARRLRASGDAGMRWLLERVDEDGRPEGADDYLAAHRLPWTFAMAGERGAAARALTWVEDHVLDERGGLRDEPANARFFERNSTYPLAIIAYGAWELERYATANRVLDRLRDYQSPDTGGAYAQPPDRRTSERTDLFPTAQLGMTALVAGRTEMARAAYAWLQRLYAAQPQLPHKLYSGWNERGLMLEIPEGHEFALVTDLTASCQAFFNPGIAAAFCGRYLAATGDESARELGRAFMALSAEGTEAQFDFAQSRQICKWGWGAATMLDADSQGDHLRHLLRMVDWYCDSQEEDGHWINSPFLDPNPTPGTLIEITSEFVLHVCTMLTALEGMRDGD